MRYFIIIISMLVGHFSYAFTTDVEVQETERNEAASKLNAECGQKFAEALKGRDTILNMKKPTLGLLSDSARRKAHYDNLQIHVQAFDDMAGQASEWINTNKKLVSNEIKREYFERAKEKYSRECQSLIDGLNGFVDWTISGSKNPLNIVTYIDAVKKAAKSGYLGQVE